MVRGSRVVAAAEAVAVVAVAKVGEQRQVRGQVAQRMAPPVVRVARLHLVSLRHHEGARHGQEGGRDEGLLQHLRVAPDRLHDDPGVARQDRELHHQAADLGEPALLVQRVQQAEQLHRRGDPFAAGRREKVELLELGDPQVGHAQHHLRQVGAVDLLQLEQRALPVRLLGVEPVAGARTGAPGAPAALVAGGMRDRLLDEGRGGGCGVL